MAPVPYPIQTAQYRSPSKIGLKWTRFGPYESFNIHIQYTRNAVQMDFAQDLKNQFWKVNEMTRTATPS